MTETKLEPAVEEFLKGKGYRVIGRLGEGHTRDVYEVEYQQGSLQKRRVLKVPKTEIDENSVTTLINRSKGDLDEREVLALNKVSHPNIVEIYDAFKIDGKTLTVEEHYYAVSLEDLIRLTGPLTEPERFKKIFEQVAEGLNHLHSHENILHRDIKPSNILVGRQENTVKLSDLQTAGKRDQIEQSFLPTRGGTKYTAPELLNALISGKETRADIASEYYALGATMFYALTGKPLFDTELAQDENGIPITVDGKTVKAILKENGQRISQIDVSRHDRLLEEKLKEVPRQYRKLLRKCLSATKPIYTDSRTNTFRKDFEDAVNKNVIPWQTIKRHAILYTTLAGLISGVIGGIKFMSLQEKMAGLQEPAIHEAMSTGIFIDGGLDYVLKDSDVLEQLVPYFKQIREQKNPLQEGRDGILANPYESYMDMQRMSQRLCYSLLRSAIMENQTTKRTEYKETRHIHTLVPKKFSDRLIKDGISRSSNEEEFRQIVNSILYLKHQLGSSDSLAELYTTYFCEPQELFEARQKSNNRQDYFTTIRNGQKIQGYSEYLSETKRNLINRAIALYHITDNEGKIHYDLLDSNNKPTRGLTDK